MTLPPRRLLDDPEVSSGLRDDLRQVMAHPGPAYDVEAGVARFEAMVGRASAPARKWSLRFIVTGVVVGAATAAAAALGYRALVAIPDPANGVTQPAVSAVPAAAEKVRGSGAPVLAASTEHASDVPAPEARPQSSTRPVPILKKKKIADPSTIRAELLRREVAHLAEVRAALASSPARSLELANSGHGEFAGGALYVEREALAISALSRLGRLGEARARGDRLLAAYPRHPFAEQVRRQTAAK